jgi:hypothetical protein
MKKIVYLMLTLLMLSAVGANAQVTIGSLDNPHPGAVLDLHSDSLGFLLPTVSLNDVSVFQLATDTARANGMAVYNTNPAIGRGLYIWDGGQWNRVVTGVGVSTGCSEAPEVPGAIALPANVETNVPFTAEVPAVTGNNAPTSYTWHLPAGLTGTSTDRIISITATTAKTYAVGSITVTATNDCGTSNEQSSTTAVTVTQAVGPGETIKVGSNTYATYCYPGTVGCWMIQNSKEGTPSSKQYDNKPEGERGYYYSRVLALGACPADWSLPSVAQWKVLETYIEGATESTERGHWFDVTTLAGCWWADMWQGWGSNGAYATNEYQSYVAAPTLMGGFSVFEGMSRVEEAWFAVRCIKNK